MEDLGFHLEQRGVTWVVVYETGGCRPASEVEVQLWKILKGESNE